MATIWEETKKQGAKMKGRSFKEKLEYFWEYYRIHTLILIGTVAVIGSLIHAYVTSREYALSIVMINSVADQFNGLTDGWTSDLTDILDFDPKEYEVYIDTSLVFGGNNVSANQEYASLQKFAALMSSSSMDIIISDSASFERNAQNNYLYDLRKLYSEEELEKLSDILYYTDAATFSDYSDDTDPNKIVDQSVYTVNHHDPTSMKDPIPVGFFADSTSLIGSSGAYAYLSEEDTYQGYPQEPVMGIVINTPRTEAAITGIGYFLNR